MIQGTAADVLKLKLIELDQADVAQYLCLPIHDELVFDVPLDVIDDVQNIIEKVMPEFQRFSVPLTVSGERTDRWGSKYRDVA